MFSFVTEETIQLKEEKGEASRKAFGNLYIYFAHGLQFLLNVLVEF